jgi:hypothetical protein
VLGSDIGRRQPGTAGEAADLRALAAAGDQFLGGGTHRFLMDVRQHHCRARLREGFRSRQAHARASPR